MTQWLIVSPSAWYSATRGSKYHHITPFLSCIIAKLSCEIERGHNCLVWWVSSLMRVLSCQEISSSLLAVTVALSSATGPWMLLDVNWILFFGEFQWSAIPCSPRFPIFQPCFQCFTYPRTRYANARLQPSVNSTWIYVQCCQSFSLPCSDVYAFQLSLAKTRTNTHKKYYCYRLLHHQCTVRKRLEGQSVFKCCHCRIISTRHSWLKHPWANGVCGIGSFVRVRMLFSGNVKGITRMWGGK